MKLVELFEDTQSDLSTHHKADEFLSALIKHLLDESQRMDQWGFNYVRINGERYVQLIGYQFGLQDEDEDLRLWIERNPSVGVANGYYTISKGGRHIIVLRLPGDPVIEEDEIPELVTTLTHSHAAHQVLKHEFVHYLDAKRFALKKGSRGDSGSKEYFNSPTEFNAYYFNVADKLATCIRNMQRNEVRAEFLAQIFGVTTDFNQTIKNILGPKANMYTRAFLSVLNERNRRAMLKRLYGLHQVAVGYLKKGSANADQ